MKTLSITLTFLIFIFLYIDLIKIQTMKNEIENDRIYKKTDVFVTEPTWSEDDYQEKISVYYV